MIAAAVLYIATLSKKDKADLIKKVQAKLEGVAEYLGDYSANPPAFTSDKADSMYVLRGETDIHIVEMALRFYGKGQVGADVVVRAVEQLDRDIEDIPPSLADKPVPHGRRI